jgi:hypothetical protein
MPRLMQDRPAFDILPFRNVDNSMLVWEQYDNFKGLQQVRGYNGQPPTVKPVGIKQYSMVPGVYGEFMPIDELELSVRRTIGTFGDPVNLSELVMLKQDHLLQRRLDRQEYIIWTLLATGTFSIPGQHGSIIHTDTFPLQTYTSINPWSNLSTSAPLADFSAVQLLSRGFSVDFGAAAVAYMNRFTFNNLRQNTNAQDLYGRRTAGLGTFNNLQGINALLIGDDLPQIVVYDMGYQAEDGSDRGLFTPFIPNNVVIVIGKRPAGQTIGEFRLTRNVNNPDMSPGPYMRVLDRGEIEVPRNIEVHDGWNGGPVLSFPSSIVVMAV